MSTSFSVLANLCEKLESTKKRLAMIDLVAHFLRDLEVNEIEPAVSMILGRAFPRWNQETLDVSWTTLSNALKKLAGTNWSAFSASFRQTGDVGTATKTLIECNGARRQATLFKETLTVLEVRRSFQLIAGSSGFGSREKKERIVTSLFSAASSLEAKYLIKIFVGEMRTGFHEGLMEQAVSKAFQVPLKLVQKASMIEGDIGEVSVVAMEKGEKGLLGLRFKVFRPVQLMLAQMANSVDEALKEHGGESGFEFKYDGARVQIHKLRKKILIFSRRLTEVTDSLPEIVEVAKRNIEADEGIFEGEVIAVDDLGAPIPFQHLMRRFGRVHLIEDEAERVPLKLYLFDVLYIDGKSLIDLNYSSRRQILTEKVGNIELTAQKVTDNCGVAEDFLKKAMEAGHEGLMAKRLDSPYTPGVRGKKWLKIKPVLEPLDLAIVGAEYGYGRRHGWLSDYYLAARNSETGEFFTVGKTFKGLTDSEIVEMTKRLKDLTIGEDTHSVVVIPKIVVEVLYNEIQTSPTYESGMALRFARIGRIRDDKAPDEVDTIQRVREIFERQFLNKGRYKNDFTERKRAERPSE
jgi:DNA ligase-1